MQTLAQKARHFNQLLEDNPAAIGPKFKTIKKFSDQKAADRRIAALEELIAELNANPVVNENRAADGTVEVSYDELVKDEETEEPSKPKPIKSKPTQEKINRTVLEVAAPDGNPDPVVRALFPKNPDKFRPAVEGMLIRYRLLRENGHDFADRKLFVATCEARGIKRSTAGRQWGFTWAELDAKFKEVYDNADEN